LLPSKHSGGIVRTFRTSPILILLFALTISSVAVRAADCSLNSAKGKIQHVIYVQFDNVHFTRDIPNVPSDLEQMPNLLNFLRHKGTLLTNHHTPLISHTADDIITSLAGVYPDRQGEAVANSYVIFTPTGFSFPSSFTYWTDPVNTTTDTAFNLITADGKNAPAPWVPFTRAGCNVGAVSIADMELENTTSDLNTVFGPTSTEVQEAVTDSKSKDPIVRAQPAADFEGIAIHCAPGASLCSSANGGVNDALPQEPLGYSGFSALFGHKFVAPVINGGSAALRDLDGNVITDSRGNIGFPGFGPITAAQTLAYTAAMQEHGIPITFSYISDAHDGPTQAFGPGEAGYVARLASYDEAWGKFFSRLSADGINEDNTLFVVTADEGDHFAGGPPSPANCDGVNIPCTYAKLGEIDSNIASLLQKKDPTILPSSFAIHFDMAPAFYIKGQPATGDPVLRSFERATAQLTAVSPITGNTDTLTRFLVDHPTMGLLHMITGDPLRTPSFIMFGDPDYFFVTSGPDAVEDPGFAWNHGGVDPKINVTFLGLVGPGVQQQGVTGRVWSDHTDIRPTLLSLVGLKDDYISDGRVLVETLAEDSLPHSLREGERFTELAQVYKQINAPLGDLGMDALAISTTALAGDNQAYTTLENQITAITSQRNMIASQIRQLLDGAEFQGNKIDEHAADDLISQANRLLKQVRSLRRGSSSGSGHDDE
jgi:hypothetical protein